ncbi:amino acid transporter [Heterobasidion irregulare TC 32-1]|uniref:Amino acid transporter n=1 Tax=Heterobasidion irregulare (strain TC 32-1) TaxID=747525 RepID=W4KG91_HETIT|nr:amino acid transporter [Heterobasidion irregulare TC 32-1]ETW84091.1 amino acid transporter [Heterobasidion irregulare TC 32-1]
MSKEEKQDASVESAPVHNDLTAEQLGQRHADNALLAELGYKSEFKREFSLIETIAFAFSIMGIVASVSSTLSFPLVSGGHVGMVFGWLIPCFPVLCIAASMAELTSAMPTSAGLYYYSAKLAPPKYAPLASWITGWANITGQVSLVCSIDFTCAEMITTAIAVGTDGRVVLGSGATFGILLAILFSHGIVCSAATSVLAKLNLFYVVINVGTSIAAIIALLVGAGDDRVSTRDAFTLFENNTGWANDGWAFLLAFTAPMWTLTGYDSAAHVSEEVAGASRAAPIAIMVGVVATQSLGWLLFIAASFATKSVTDLLNSDLPLPMGQLFLDTLGKRGMLTIWSFIIVYVTGAAQGVDASRVVFAFARDNALPGSRWWKEMNSRTQTPVNAVWLVMILSGILGVLGFSEAALSLFRAAVIGLYTSYVTPIFLRITSGRTKLVLGPFNLGKWYTLSGSIAVAWVAFIVVLLLFPTAQKTTAAGMNYSVVLIMAVFLFAAGSWVLSARKWFTGPVSNLSKTASREEEKVASTKIN